MIVDHHVFDPNLRIIDGAVLHCTCYRYKTQLNCAKSFQSSMKEPSNLNLGS